MSNPARSRSGGGCWSGQIGASALLGVGLVACSVVMFAAGTDEPGGAVLLALLGLVFLTTLGWAIDEVTRSTSQQRALFAWAITQHEAAGHGNDALALREAALARDGKLGVTRIRALQAHRPDNLYPGDLPVSGAAGDRSGVARTEPPNRTATALIALFLALTGLYFSCFPSIFVLGWPFQLVASILAVIAIIPPGRDGAWASPRRAFLCSAPS